MEGPRDIALIALAEARRTLRSARAGVLLGLFGLFSALVLLIVRGISESARRQLEEQLALGAAAPEAATQLAEQLRRPMIATFFGSDEALLGSLDSLPLAALALLKATFVFLPLYVAIMGFDQLSGEIGPRSIRYLAVRTRRSSILFGKWGAQLLVLACLILLVNAGSVFFLSVVDPDFGGGHALGTFLRFSGITFVFALTYTALAAFCSALARSPAVSLVTNLLVLLGLWLVSTVGAIAAQGSGLALVRFASPWGFHPDLLHPAGAQLLSAIGAHLAFAALFLAGAWGVLRRADL